MGGQPPFFFAKEGAQETVADIDSTGGEETVSRIKDNSGNAIFFKTDITDSDEIQELINITASAFGKINILFNNAGIGNSEARSVDITEEEWDRVLDINLKGVFLGIKYTVPELVKSGGGSIINTSSLLGLKGPKYLAPYSASK